jgi:hypothetical protein
VLTAPIQSVRRDRAVNYVWRQTRKGPVAVQVTVGANNQVKVANTSGLAEGDVIYRTPPGGQADPKFDQPALPEIAPAKPRTTGSSDAPRVGAGNRERGNREGGSRRNGNRSRQKYSEMSPEELSSSKDRLASTADRMSGMLSGENLRIYNKSVQDIVKAIESNELVEADRLQAVMTATIRKAMSGMRNRGEGGGNRGEGGGNRSNRDHSSRGNGGE